VNYDEYKNKLEQRLSALENLVQRKYRLTLIGVFLIVFPCMFLHYFPSLILTLHYVLHKPWFQFERWFFLRTHDLICQKYKKWTPQTNYYGVMFVWNNQGAYISSIKQHIIRFMFSVFINGLACSPMLIKIDLDVKVKCRRIVSYARLLWTRPACWKLNFDIFLKYNYLVAIH
jgi:hypothetical protein